MAIPTQLKSKFSRLPPVEQATADLDTFERICIPSSTLNQVQSGPGSSAGTSESFLVDSTNVHTRIFFIRGLLDTSLHAKFESAPSRYKLELPSY